MRVKNVCIHFNSCAWFEDRCPAITDAKNALEREIRLIWLSEGVLGCNLFQQSDPGTAKKEINLFWEFVLHQAYANRPDMRPAVYTPNAGSHRQEEG